MQQINEVIHTMIAQVKHSLRDSSLKARNIIFDNDNNSINFVVIISASYTYKIYMRYNYGQDLYEMCFMRLYTGNDMNREDWYTPRFTQWETDIYADMLQDMIESLYFNRNKHTYFTIQELM